MIKILELLREQQAIELTDIEEDVFVRHFLKAGMRPRQFKALFKQAKLVQFDDGAVLHKEGEVQPPSVRLLLKGAVDITLNGERVFTVDAEKPICFLGDTHVLEECDRGAGNSYLPAFSATATAVAPLGEKVVALEWTNDCILRILSTKSETSSKLRAVLTGSVVQKLVNIGASSALEKYSTLMFAFSTDGVLNGLEKKLLEEYRDAHHITPQQHLQCLQRIGWSEDEYKRGLQKDCAQAVYPMFFAFSDKLGDLLKDFNAKKPSSQIMQDLQISKKSNDDGPSTTINNKSSS